MCEIDRTPLSTQPPQEPLAQRKGQVQNDSPFRAAPGLPHAVRQENFAMPLSSPPQSMGFLGALPLSSALVPLPLRAKEPAPQSGISLYRGEGRKGGPISAAPSTPSASPRTPPAPFPCGTLPPFLQGSAGRRSFSAEAGKTQGHNQSPHSP